MGFWGKLAGLGTMAGGAGLMFVPGAQVAGLGLMGAGAGLSKHEFDDIPKEQAATELASQTQRYAPWTGLKAQMPDKSSAFGSALQGGAMGLMAGQGLSAAGLLSGGTAAAGAASGLESGVGSVPTLGVDTSLKPSLIAGNYSGGGSGWASLLKRYGS